MPELFYGKIIIVKYLLITLYSLLKKSINRVILLIFLLFYNIAVYAADPDSIQITGVKDMLQDGQSLVLVAAKWGGIVTVICAALALGRGKLEGAMAQTIVKILVVVGLLIAATKFFGDKIQGFMF